MDEILYFSIINYLLDVAIVFFLLKVMYKNLFDWKLFFQIVGVITAVIICAILFAIANAKVAEWLFIR